MGITVREALKLPALQNARLVAGKQGLEGVIISVNVMEVPDISRFVKSGELLVTTTYPIKDDKTSQLNLILNLVQLGAAALAIEPVYYENDIPSYMIELADKLGFPLIKLPENTSFNEIINPIMEEILNRQAVVLRRNYEIHKSFINLVLNGGSLAEITQMIASIRGAAVSIHTVQMKMLAYSMPETGEDHCRALANDSQMLHQLLEGGKDRATLQSGEAAIEIIVHPVSVAGEKYANIILWLTGEEPNVSGPYEVNMIEQVSTVVALELTKLRAIADVEQRFRNKIIDDLLQGKIKSREDLLSRGESYGWDLSAGFIPMVLEISGFKSLYENTALNVDYMRILRRFLEIVNVAANYRCANAIVVDMHTHCIVLLPVKNAGSQKEMAEKAHEIGKQIQAKMSIYKDVQISVGIGRYTSDIMALEQGYEQANQASEIGRMIKEPNSITHFDDLGVYRILAVSRHNPELERFGKELLGGLIEGDKTVRTDFIRTLDVVLRYYDNLREASRELFIHHNTLRYRMNKIQKMTGVNLKSAEARLNLQIALKIIRMHEKI